MNRQDSNSWWIFYMIMITLIMGVAYIRDISKSLRIIASPPQTQVNEQ